MEARRTIWHHLSNISLLPTQRNMVDTKVTSKIKTALIQYITCTHMDIHLYNMLFMIEQCKYLYAHWNVQVRLLKSILNTHIVWPLLLTWKNIRAKANTSTLGCKNPQTHTDTHTHTHTQTHTDNHVQAGYRGEGWYECRINIRSKGSRTTINPQILSLVFFHFK